MSNAGLIDLDELLPQLPEFWTRFLLPPGSELVKRHQRSLVLERLLLTNLLDHLDHNINGDGRSLAKLPFWMITVSADDVWRNLPWTVGDGSTIGDASLVIGEGQPHSVFSVPGWVRSIGALTDDQSGDGGAYILPDEFTLRGRDVVSPVNLTTVFDVYTEDGSDWIDIWLRDLTADFEILQSSRGEALRAPSVSEPEYDLALKLLLQLAHEGGQLQRDALTYLAAAVPTATEGQVVQEIDTVGDTRLIVTDGGVYHHPAVQNTLVNTSDILSEGQPLSDGLIIRTGDSAGVPDSHVLGLRFLAVDAGGTFEIVAENRDHQWVDIGGQLRFPLFNGDRYWSMLLQSGVDPAAELGAAVGDVVNPMTTLLGLLYDHNFWVAAARVDQLSSVRPFIDHLRPYGSPGAYLTVVNTLPGVAADPDVIPSPGEATAFYIGQASDTLDLSTLPPEVSPSVFLG